MLLRTLAGGYQSRRAKYYSVRRDAGRLSQRRARLTLQFMLLAALLYVSSIATESLARRSAQPPRAPEATPALPVQAPSLDQTPTLAQTKALPPPTETPRATAPAARLTPSPTFDLIPLLPTSTPTPTQPAEPVGVKLGETPPPLARDRNGPLLMLRAISAQPPQQGLPPDNGGVFPAGTPTVYIVFDHRAIPPRAAIRHTWFRDGSSVHFGSVTLDTSEQVVGSKVISWSPEGGFVPGLYEVRVMLGSTPQFVANFEVR